MKKFLKQIQAQIASRSENNAANMARFFGDNARDKGTARLGLFLMKLSVFIQVLTPVIALVGIFALSSISVFAQGGPIFGQNDQTAGRGLVEFIKYFRNVIFLLGVFFFGWGAVNLAMEKPWGSKVIGGVCCWAFAALAALAYSFSQGNAVNLDTDLGN